MRKSSLLRPARAAALGLLLPALAPTAPAALPAAGFLENRGQLPESVRYYSPSGGLSAWFTDGAILLSRAEDAGAPDLPGGRPGPVTECSARLVFENANPSPRIEARTRLPGEYHFLTGNDPAAWRTGVAAYAEIVYRDLWPGVDLLYRRSGDALEFQLLAAPGADAGRARFSLPEGPPAGRLEVKYPDASRHSGSISWSPQDPASPIETATGVLLWSSYLGSFAQRDAGKAITLDAGGNPVVVGFTRGSDFPATPGAFQTVLSDLYDVFVAKVSADGSELVWATFLGGSGFDFGTGVDLAAFGNVVLCGTTGSDDFPITPDAFDSVRDLEDMFAAKLSADGSTLLWSTFVGGVGNEQANGIAADADGNVRIAGITNSSDYPATPGAFDVSYNGLVDGCVTLLDPDTNSLVWSSYLGSTGHDYAAAIAVTSAGETIVTGTTGAPGAGPSDFPVTAGAFDQTHDGGNDVFVAKFDAAGDLAWSTFLGGGLDVYESFQEYGRAVAVDALDRPIVGGNAIAGFPTTPGAFDETANGSTDGFLAQLDASGSTLLWSTFVGGSGQDEIWGVAVGSDGDPVVTGFTASADFPSISGSVDDTFNGNRDAFVLLVAGLDGSLLACSYLGGAGEEYGAGIAMNASGHPIVTGWTKSLDFPTTPGALEPDPGAAGMQDAFVSALLLQPRTGVAAAAAGTDLHPPALVATPNPGRVREPVRFAARAPVAGAVALFDARGRLVRTLAAPAGAAAGGEVLWDGRDDRGRFVEPGVFFYTFSRGGEREGGKLVILR